MSQPSQELSGFISETEAIDFFASQGYTNSFTAEKKGLVCVESGDSYQPRQITIREVARFEGVSDIADMSVVYAIETEDGAKGTLVDAFGPRADPLVGELLQTVVIEHAEVERSDLPSQYEQDSEDDEE